MNYELGVVGLRPIMNYKIRNYNDASFFILHLMNGSSKFFIFHSSLLSPFPLLQGLPNSEDMTS